MGIIIKRSIQSRVESDFFKKKVIIIYGVRQVGKTTIIKEIQKKYQNISLYFNCDEPDVRKQFTDVTSTELKSIVGDKKIVFFDEAQRVKNIGITLKLLIDNYPDIQLVATGSSSFDLSNKIVEPLTGRKYEFYLYPFSLDELSQIYNFIEIDRLLKKRIIYGLYPEVILNEVESRAKIREITKSYLYNDIFQYQQIKNPDILEKLLQALALQIGSEVSYNELSNLLGISKITVERYMELLEKAFVIFRLKPFSNNLRDEISTLRKIYFWDTGVRNALINNFNELELRSDVGALWENFIISERLKSNNNLGIDINSYFWRTHQRQEVDYIEVENVDKISAYEIKWQEKKAKLPISFSRSYPKSSFSIINNKNYKDFLKIREQKNVLNGVNIPHF